MRTLLIAALGFSLSVSTLAAGRGGQSQAASIAGVATNPSGQPLVNVTVQLRNLTSGSLSGTTTSSAMGTFAFTGVQTGMYAVEVVNAAGQIIGSSASLLATAGATITGVSVSASTAGAIAGSAGAAAGAASGISTAAVVTGLAAAAGVAGAAAIAATASGSR